MANETRNDSTRNSDTRKGYNPITADDVRNAYDSPFFAGLETSSARALGGILFFVIFVVSRNVLPVSAIVLVVLLACLLYRMDKRERQIAAIPLTFSAVRLGFQISEQLSLWRPRYGSPADALAASRAFESGIHWLPLFFCAYLFYSPWKQSYTSRLVFWYSMILVLSGLLPGEGYLYICSMLFYTLFVALIITLVLDLHPKVFNGDSPVPEQRVQPATS
jgi:hypothetical protein